MAPKMFEPLKFHLLHFPITYALDTKHKGAFKHGQNVRILTILPKDTASRKHAYIILTPLNPTFI